MAEPSGGGGRYGAGVPLTPEWYGHEIGRLRAIGLLVNKNGHLWGVLFQCACGRAKGLVKAPLWWLTQNQMPFQCALCRRKKTKKRYPRGLKTRYPSEWRAWKNLRDRKLRPRCWSKFKFFIRDLGPRPDGLVLRKRDYSKPHGKGNSHWGDPFLRVRPLFIGDEQITPAYLKRKYGIRKSFTRHLQSKGITDAAEVIRTWESRHHPRNSGDLSDGRDQALSAGEGGPTHQPSLVSDDQRGPEEANP